MRAPEGLTDLLRSERGAFAFCALIASAVLAVLGRIDGAQWLDFQKFLGTALITSKTLTTAVESYVTKQPQIAPLPKATVVKEGPRE